MFPFTGEYEEHIRKGPQDFSFFTFTPRPLREGAFFKMDEELSALLVSTHRLLGTLDGMIKYMPDGEIIQELMILRECYYSRLIDYQESPFLAILAGMITGKKDVDHIANIVSAYKYAIGQGVNSITLSKICSIALYGHETKEKIETREKQIFLGKAISNMKSYNPTAPIHILPAIADISGFLAQDESIDVLIKAALAHYQLEMVHPYEYYNGIMGRIMVPMILHNADYQAAAYICLSEFLYYNKNEYFETMRTTQYSAGYIVWINFFVQGIYEAAKCSIAQIEKLEQIIVQDEAKIKSSKMSTKSVLMVYNYFKKNLVSTIKPASDQLFLSFNTVAKAIDVLLRLGILQLDNGQSRHRRFLYREIMDIYTLK